MLIVQDFNLLRPVRKLLNFVKKDINPLKSPQVILQNLGLVESENFFETETAFIKRKIEKMIRVDLSFANEPVNKLKNQRGLANAPQAGNKGHLP
ncbi:MAG: hypothetical protein ONB46_14315 [candidate division KSB1 bacterium]|nr:hypothetical protein [candidate division KSB1 bacterium]MDZ7366886.1 hypothetical protein [candidate division KSB1 bacterium]MDZ7406055.1 hypothetical protein [candidate division KSB1 bacterium]